MEKDVSFKNGKNQKIVGNLHVPSGKGLFPAVIILHGFKGFKDQQHIKLCAGALCDGGFVAFRFDSSNGVGESDGDIFDADMTGYLDDIQCALEYLEGIDVVDNSRIGLTGHSFGGQALLITAARDERIKVIVPQCATFQFGQSRLLNDLEVWKTQGYKVFSSTSKRREFKVGYHFIEDRLNYDDNFMVELVKGISIPTRVIQSENDESVSLESGKHLFETLTCEKDMHIIKDAPHTWRDPVQLEEVASLVTGWFEKHLK